MDKGRGEMPVGGFEPGLAQWEVAVMCSTARLEVLWSVPRHVNMHVGIQAESSDFYWSFLDSADHLVSELPSPLHSSVALGFTNADGCIGMH